MGTPTTRRRRPTAADPPAESRPLVGVPTFSPPIGRGEIPPPDPGPAEEELTTGHPLPNRPDVGSWIGSGGGGPTGESPTRTGTSSDDLSTTAGKGETARNAGVLLAGLLTVVAGLAALGLARVGRQLRRPSKDETRAVARPIARILVRHVPADMITADLADLGEAGAAVSDYVSAGPVAPRVVPVHHIGMVPPDDPPAPAGGGPVDAPDVPPAPTTADVLAAAHNLDMFPTALDDGGPQPKVEYLS